jgi:hypothetical protein
MIALYTRVSIPHRNLTGIVIKREFVPRNGIVYRILIDTTDGSHTEALYGASSVRVAIDQRPADGGNVVAMPRRVGLRLAAVDGRVVAP